jgi:two-component system LytT family response regulator
MGELGDDRNADTKNFAGYTNLGHSLQKKDYEELLSPATFIRMHHSWIINKNHIQKYIKGEGGQVIMCNGKTLDVARRRKDEFVSQITQLNRKNLNKYLETADLSP